MTAEAANRSARAAVPTILTAVVDVTGVAPVAGEIPAVQQLCFSYSDMSIHVARQSLTDFATTLLSRPTASIIVTANVDVHGSWVDFGRPSQRVLSTPNAGGPSIMSEALSAEIMDRLFGIRKILTETEVKYSTHGPITDYACYSATSQALGVSVTRAMAYGRRFTTKDAIRLMLKKVHGVNKSNKSVENYKFERQILHVWAANGTDAAIVRRVCAKIPDYIRSNTIILITTVNMDSVFASN